MQATALPENCEKIRLFLFGLSNCAIIDGGMKPLLDRSKPREVAAIAVEIRQNHSKLDAFRLVSQMTNPRLQYAEHYRPYVAQTLNNVILQAEDILDFVAVFAKEWVRIGTNGNVIVPMPKQIKLGLSLAFNKFISTHHFTFLERDHNYSYRQILIMSHAKPNNEAQARLFKWLMGEQREESISNAETKVYRDTADTAICQTEAV